MWPAVAWAHLQISVDEQRVWAFNNGRQMAAQLDADAERDLDGILSAARDMLESCRWFWETRGEIPPHMLSGIEALQDDMIRLLALFEDGELYGRAPHGATDAMRNFEQDACEILEFHGRLVS